MYILTLAAVILTTLFRRKWQVIKGYRLITLSLQNYEYNGSLTIRNDDPNHGNET